ncbi:MAG TPA: tetratricopeptide repeat protein [Phycisphaerae bacterium]|nr:tetratricopeptide repeat protein [Phycisphaerae bacterium]
MKMRCARMISLAAAVVGGLAGQALGDTSDPQARAFFAQGAAMIEHGQWVQSAGAFEQAINADMQFPEAYLFHGLARMYANDYQEAAEDFTAYAVLNPGKPWGWQQRAVARLGEGRPERAEEDFRRAAALGAAPANIQRGMGDVYRAEKKYREALAAYTDGIRLAPRSPTMYQRRALAELALGDKQGAAADMAQADALVRSGRELEPGDEASQAMEDAYRRLVGHRMAGPAAAPARAPAGAAPAAPPAVVVDRAGQQQAQQASQAAASLAQRGDVAGALRQMDSAVTLDPNNASYWTMRGAFQEQLGKPDDAVGSYQRSLGLDVKNADGHLGLGVALAELQKTSDARTEIEAGLKLARLPQVQGALAMATGAANAHPQSAILKEVVARLQTALSEVPR